MAETFRCQLQWSGAAKGPTADASYSRDLAITGETAPNLSMSAASSFKGDPARWNPEQLLVASLSACLALTYLHLAATNGIQVVAYADSGEGKLGLASGKMCITHVTLRPVITLAAGSDREKATGLVEKAHAQCFISNSVTTRVEIHPTIEMR